MDYDGVTEYIFNLKRFGIKLGLERVQSMLNRLNNPEKRLKYVHIGGTNGKGSTTAMVSSVLTSAGYRVGVFTSPHLSDFTERITISGRRISKRDVVRLFEELVPVARAVEIEYGSAPTFFEFITVLAIEYFAESKVDIAVMEVGLGGRLDSTNVIQPLVAVITNIGLENMDILGDTREKIALEKAGIIKPHCPLITAADPAVYDIFHDVCRKRNSPIYRVGSEINVKGTSTNESYQIFNISGFGIEYDAVDCKLIGEHQLSNIGCAFGVVAILNQNGFVIDERAFREGLKSVEWPGRLEIVQNNPKIVLDCAKDPLAMEALRNSLIKIFKYDRLILVLSISSDKNTSLMLDNILPISDLVIATKHNVRGRAMDPKELAKKVKTYNKKVLVEENINDAINIAIRNSTPNSLICVTGSVFLVGEARERWHKKVAFWGRETNESRDIRSNAVVM
jgi:dihydrofolate synthase/folylpolyglutamate synthase